MTSLGTGLAIAATRFVSGVRVEWHESLEPVAQPRIFFANHASHLDFMVIWAALPKCIREATRPVAARDYWEKGRLRRYLAERVFRAALIERHRVTRASNPIAQLEEIVTGEGSSIIIFPEGTRGLGGEIGPFKSGLYHLAKRLPEIPLVPVYLENLNRILPKGERLPIPLLSHCRFGAPLALRKDEGKHDFLDRARRGVIELSDGDPAVTTTTNQTPQ